MSVENTMSDKIQQLDLGNQTRARKALREAAELYEKNLKQRVPIDADGSSQKGKLKAGVTKSGVKSRGGILTVDVGYAKSVGWRAKFPNFGTVKQDPQHFQDEAEQVSVDPIRQIFLDHLRIDKS